MRFSHFVSRDTARGAGGRDGSPHAGSGSLLFRSRAEVFLAFGVRAEGLVSKLNAL